MDGLGLLYKVQTPVFRVSQCLRNLQNYFFCLGLVLGDRQTVVVDMVIRSLFCFVFQACEVVLGI